MKFTLPLLITLFSTSAFADVDLREFMPGFASKNKSLSCRSGDGQSHTNPDNSPSGFVAKTAKVEAGALIAANAQVCDQAQVKSGARILGQAVIGGRAQINSNAEISGFAQVMGEARVSSGVKISGNAVIEGSPQISGATLISGLAKIEGGSKIHNSIICQASLITNFDVIDSDYYFQTEDPEPPHPGEMGKRSLLGVDSDLDGVRDDVEIWINSKLSNSPGKDMTNTRIALKQLTKQMRNSIKVKDIQDSAKDSYKKEREAQKCFFDVYNNQDSAQEILSELMKNNYNTMDRLKAYVTIKGQNAGIQFEKTNSKKFYNCNFKLK